jgi:hypothetical protein
MFKKGGGAVHKVGNGDQARFWIDVCLDRVPLGVSFWELFEVCSDPEAMVGKLVEEGCWRVDFRRELDEHQLEMWEVLQDKLRSVEMSRKVIL